MKEKSGNCEREDKKVYIILHNVRSAHNVGAIFRTADAAGVAKIFLTGYTGTPTDRFGRPRADIQKTALGAEGTVLWEYARHPKTVFAKLKKEGTTIVALEQSGVAQEYKHYVPKYPLAILLGNEVRGISRVLQECCDSVLEIPMRGKKESLNVSVAAGIALFRILDI